MNLDFKTGTISQDGASIDAQKVYRSIANNLYINNKTIICTCCGTRKPVTADEIFTYITSGWPNCCGYTMTLIKE